MVQINITIEADGDNALQLLQLLQGTSVSVESEVQTEEVQVETEEAQEETTPEPLKRSMWTEEEDAELLRLWNAGNGSKACAKALNRSQGAIGNRVASLRAKLGDKVRLGKQGRHMHDAKTAKTTTTAKPKAKPKPAPKTNNLTTGKWTTQQDRKLVQLRKKGWIMKDIAKKLNRSVYSVKDRARILMKRGDLKSRSS